MKKTRLMKLEVYDRDKKLGEISWRAGRLVASAALGDLLVWARRRAQTEQDAFERLKTLSGHVHTVQVE